MSLLHCEENPLTNLLRNSSEKTSQVRFDRLGPREQEPLEMVVYVPHHLLGGLIQDVERVPVTLGPDCTLFSSPQNLQDIEGLRLNVVHDRED